MPKLLQPRPAIETSSDPTFLIVTRSLSRRVLRTLPPGVSRAPGYRSRGGAAPLPGTVPAPPVRAAVGGCVRVEHRHLDGERSASGSSSPRARARRAGPGSSPPPGSCPPRCSRRSAAHSPTACPRRTLLLATNLSRPVSPARSPCSRPPTTPVPAPSRCSCSAPAAPTHSASPPTRRCCPTSCPVPSSRARSRCRRRSGTSAG